MLDIKTITVIGANGTVGEQVVRLLARNLDVKVFLLCRTWEKAIQTISRIQTSAQEIGLLGTMIPADYTALEDCISNSDWVFESVAEDLSIKLEIYRQILPYLRPEILVSTGTSSFLIRQLAEPFDSAFKKQFYGTHFFNPPDKLSLLEFIPTSWNDPGMSAEFEGFLRERLGRRSVVVKDVHGFLANRIGSLFLNEAALMAMQYRNRGGIGYIDSVMGKFTGRSVPPMMTIDYIGLDVVTAMLDNVQKDLHPYPEGIQRPEFFEELIRSGSYGRKSGQGLYAQTILSNRSKEKWVFDIRMKQYQPFQVISFPFAKRMIELQVHGNLLTSFQPLIEGTDEEAMLCKYLLLQYISISYRVVGEAAYDEADVDVAMEDGYAWISPRKLVFLLGGGAGIQDIVDSDDRMKHTLAGLDATKLEAFQKPVGEIDIRFFSHVQK